MFKDIKEKKSYFIYNDRKNELYNNAEKNNNDLNDFKNRIGGVNKILIKDFFDIKKDDFEKENSILLFSNSFHYFVDNNLKLFFLKNKESFFKQNITLDYFLKKYSLKDFILNMSKNFYMKKNGVILVTSYLFNVCKENKIKGKDNCNLDNKYDFFNSYFNNPEKKNELILKSNEDDKFLILPYKLFDFNNIKKVVENFSTITIFYPNDSEFFFEKEVSLNKDFCNDHNYLEKVLSELIENPIELISKKILEEKEKKKNINSFLDGESVVCSIKNDIYRFSKFFGIVYLFRVR